MVAVRRTNVHRPEWQFCTLRIQAATEANDVKIRSMRPTIWNIKVMVETDDFEVVRTKIDHIKEALCGPEHSLGPDHQCDPPWYIVTSPMARKKAKRWRKVLNR
jgi:hypothetical protein